MLKKKVLRAISVMAVMGLMLLIFASCGGKLSGTYEIVDKYQNGNYTTVTKLYFQGSRVTVTDLHMPVECSYKIEDGIMYIDGTVLMLGTEMEVDYEFEFKEGKGSIFLDGFEYIKKK